MGQCAMSHRSSARRCAAVFSVVVVVILLSGIATALTFVCLSVGVGVGRQVPLPATPLRSLLLLVGIVLQP